jgi:Uma2 family endonuclease
VPEYWIVDPNRDVILVGRLTNVKYDYVGFEWNQAIVSPTFSRLKLTVEQVLRAGR